VLYAILGIYLAYYSTVLSVRAIIHR